MLGSFLGPTPSALLCIAWCPTPNVLLRIAGCPTPNVLLCISVSYLYIASTALYKNPTPVSGLLLLLGVVLILSEAVAQRCSVKRVFLEISQNSQENTCAKVSFLIKLQA